MLNIKSKTIFFLLAGIFSITPYIFCNYAVFIFMVPTLALFYSDKKIKNNHFILFAFLVACTVLFPIVSYDMSTYFFGITIVTIFFGAFLIISKTLIAYFKNPVFSIGVPCVVWTSLIYLLNFRSLIASSFDIGMLVPMSAPLVWYTGSIGLTILLMLFNSS